MRSLFQMKRLAVVAAALCFGASATVALSDETEVSVARSGAAVTYTEGKTLGMKLAPTFRIPEARGEAKVERKKGVTEIEIELDEMRPASGFGALYNTYVLWTLSPEGNLDNLGAFTLQGHKSKLDVTTNLGAFGMFITAEPHSMVRVPSRVVVLVNDVPKGNPDYRTADVKYEGRVGVYPVEHETLTGIPKAEGEQRTEVDQAHAAVWLAEDAQAAKWAAPQLAEAKAALAKAQAAASDPASKGKDVSELGRSTIRLAVAARDAAIKARVKDAVAEAARIKSAYEELTVKFEKVATTLKLAAVHDSARGITVDLPDALFDSGTATLRPEAREVISRIAGIMLGAGRVRLWVEGHTDNQGGPEMNLKLSRDRANAIKQYLVDAAIPTAWIETSGFGETKPVADNSTPEGRQKNRRVEIVIGRIEAAPAS